MTMIDILERLRKANFAELRRVASGSGVPFHTLHKIARDLTRNPRWMTMQKIADFYGREPADAAIPRCHDPDTQNRVSTCRKALA